MSQEYISVGAKVATALCVCFVCASSVVRAQGHDIVLRVDTVSVDPGVQRFIIPVFMDNYQDTVAGFAVTVQLNRPDLIRFHTAPDSLFLTYYWRCVESGGDPCGDSLLLTDTTGGWDFMTTNFFGMSDGAFDTTAALSSGWEFLGSNDFGSDGTLLKVVGLADQPSPSITTGIAPQSDGVLVYLAAEALEVPDTLTDRTVIIHISELIDQTSFSDPHGQLLAIGFNTVPDTTFWLCSERDPISDTCISWVEGPGPEYDSIRVSETSVPQLALNDGAVSLLSAGQGCCAVAGDADHDGSFNIADVTFGLAYIFSGGPAPFCQDEADSDGGGAFNIGDVTYGISFIFSGGSAPVCGPTGS